MWGMEIFNWLVAFHSCPNHMLPSVLMEGSLLMPGDTLIDGRERERQI